MSAQSITLALMLATVFSVSSGFIPAIFPHFGPPFVHHFGNHFPGRFPHLVNEVPIPPYIARIFHSEHFPYYRPGHSFGSKSYPINYLPPYLSNNKKFSFGRYLSYLNRVFPQNKNKH